MLPSFKKAWDAFHDNHTNQVLISSKVGLGKSYGMCAMIILSCLQYPGIRVGLARNNITLLKKTTGVSFSEVLTKWGIKDFIDYTDAKSEWTFTNGSKVVLIDLEFYRTDPEYLRLNGLLLTWAAIDEAGHLKTPRAAEVLFSRCGRWLNNDYGLSAFMLMVCNPSNNFLRSEWYDASVNGTLAPNKMFIDAKISENKFLPSDYYDNLRSTLAPRDVKRLIEGSWYYDDETLCIFRNSALSTLFSKKPLAPSTGNYLSADIALHGSDKLVIIAWEGYLATDVYTYDKIDGQALVELIKVLKAKHNVPNDNFCYDYDGLGSFLKGFFPYSREIKNGGKVLNGDNYKNLKAQLYFKLAELINKEQITIADATYSEAIREELLAIEPLDGDKVGIITKDMIKAKIRRSPDFSDALAYRMIWELKPSAEGSAFYSSSSLEDPDERDYASIYG